MGTFFEGINSSLSVFLRATGSAYTIELDQNLTAKQHYVVLVNNTGSSVDVNLPSTGSLSDNLIYVKDTLGSGSINNIRINASGSERFADGTSTKVIGTNYGFYTIGVSGSSLSIVAETQEFARMEIYEVSSSFI